jgi:acetolactate synthase-1/2/3 large subunit
VLNEAIRNGPVVLQQMPRTKAGTLIGLSGGGLGFSGGMALGLKLACPERTIVQIVGDGTFYFSNPQSTLSVGRQYKLPVLTVVLDNTGWGAVKAATLRVYPEGVARDEDEFGATLAPDMDFSKVAEAAGAHGELVSDPDAVEPAIARCLAALKDGRSALLHARVTKL